ncbi:MAG: hypothetical protein KC442_08045 [Thermomicrobiales bacterium]|nr:hypothetical protein [Thermomicrobiales bacterium]
MPRELLIASQFGTGDAIDSFMVALVLPTFLLGVLGGSVAAAFIPSYVRALERDGRPAADVLLREITFWYVALLCMASVAVVAAAPWLLTLIASGFPATKLELTRQLLYILLVTVPLGGLAFLWAAVLNARESFAVPAVSQCLIPAVGMVALLAFPEAGVNALSGGMVGGFFLRAIVLAWILLRQGTQILPAWGGLSDDTRQAIGQYAPVTIAAVLMGGTAVVDQAVAAALGSGSVATLGYGLKLVYLASNLGVMALGTAVLPFLSRMVAAHDWDQLRATMRNFSLLAFLGLAPIAAVVAYYSPNIVSIFFQRGMFTSSDAQAVAQVQAFGVWHLPFMAVGIVYVRLISSLGANQLLAIQSGALLFVNFALDVLFAQYLGVSGIALATTVLHVASLIILVAMARFALRRAEFRAKQRSG